MESVTSRLPHHIIDNDVACLSKRVNGSEINVFSNGYIQEIQLNIFPPSAIYSASHHHHHHPEKMSASKCKYCENGCQSGEEANCLSIDVIQEVNHSGSANGSKSGTSSGYGGMNDSDGEESQKKTMQGNFSHIAFKRSDSILHISIGSSSKIIKRRKRRWLTKLYKLSRGGRNSRKSSMVENCQSPEVTKDGKVFHLNNTNGLNVINDNIVISINNKKPRHASLTQPNNEAYQNQFRSILDDDLAHGANELDLYMNEIKMREMG